MTNPDNRLDTCLDGIRTPDQINHTALEGIAAWLAADEAAEFTTTERPTQ